MEEHRRRTDNLQLQGDITGLLDLMPVGIRVINRDGVCEYINQAFIDLFGYRLEEVRQLNAWFSRAYPDPVYREKIRNWYDNKVPELVHGSTPPPLSASITCKNGIKRQIIISAQIAMGRVIAIYTDITEHAAAAAQQLEIEQMFRLTFEGTRDPIFWANAENGTLVNCNLAAERMIETSRNQIIGQHFTFLHPPDVQKQITALFARVTSLPEPHEDVEAVVISRSGRRIPVSIRNSLTTIADTTIVQGIFIDRTERKRVESAINDTCRLLHKTLSSLNEAVFIVETGTRIIIDCNDTVTAMFGYQREEMIGRTTACLHTSEENSRIFGSEMLRGYQEKGYFSTEFIMRRKDGSSFYSDHFVNPIRNDQGEIISHVCVVRDISAKKEADDALRRSEVRYRAMVEAFDGLMYICSRERRIEFLNRRMIDRLGRDATGENCHEALHNFETPCHWCVNERVFSGESVQWEFQSPKDGKWYHIVNKPISDGQGFVSKQVTIVDITDRKAAEAYRVSLEAERLAFEEQRQFLGLVSHEIRTPLSIIDGAAQLILLTAAPKSTCYPQAERIRSATLRLTEVIDSCLTEERLSTSGWQPVMSEQDLSPLAARLVKQCMIRGNGHTIHAEIEPVPFLYLCDPMLMTTMLFNLLDNAIKYSPAGGKIFLRINRRSDCGVSISVSDQGIGIPPDESEKIFHRFHRTWQVQGIPGAGLGLSLVRRIAEIHAGSVSCQSSPGVGSTFTVFLP